MTNSEMISVIVRYWHDLQTGTSQLRAVRVDTSEEIHLTDGTFLLRIWTEDDSSAVRCFIRHITSGREAYIQGGPNLGAFVKACLLGDNNTVPESTLLTPEASEATVDDTALESELESPPSDKPANNGATDSS